MNASFRQDRSAVPDTTANVSELRNISSVLRKWPLLIFFAATAFCLSPILSATTAGVRIQHRVISVDTADRGRQNYELQITVRNVAAHGLYDLRIFLDRAGSIALHQCSSARLNSLAKDGVKHLNWVFECQGRRVPRLEFRDVRFRIEAVDVSTQKIETLSVASQELF